MCYTSSRPTRAPFFLSTAVPQNTKYVRSEVFIPSVIYLTQLPEPKRGAMRRGYPSILEGDPLEN